MAIVPPKKIHACRSRLPISTRLERLSRERPALHGARIVAEISANAQMITHAYTLESAKGGAQAARR
jgi:hypothetical protein